MPNTNSTSGLARTTIPLSQNTPALQQLRELLQLPLNLSDASILNAALAAAALEECGQNPQFAQRIRQHYENAMRTRTRPIRRNMRREQEELPPLKPIGRVDGPVKIDPYAPPDPALLVQVYGKHQLERALQEYSHDRLKQTALQIEARNPGTKPANRGRRDSIIAYIVAYANKTY